MFFFGCFFCVYAQQFEVNGRVNFSVPGKPVVSTYFNAVIEGAKWNIKLTQDTKKLYDYEEISFDGEYSYNVSSIKSNIEERRQHGEKVGDNVATAWVSKEPFFRSIFVHEAGPVWLAYASGHFFSTFTNHVIEPIIAYNCEPIPSADSTLVKQKVEWSSFQDFPYLPRSALFLDNGSLLTEPLRKRQPPYDKGFTNVIFHVLETTNFYGMILPIKVAVDVFCPLKTGLGLLCSYEISDVKVNVESNNFSFKPSIPGLTYVTDGRFVSEAGLIAYPIKTNWLSETEVRSFPQFANGKAVASVIERNIPVPPTSPTVLWIIRCFLILTILVSPILIWYSLNKTNKTKKINP